MSLAPAPESASIFCRNPGHCWVDALLGTWLRLVVATGIASLGRYAKHQGCIKTYDSYGYGSIPIDTFLGGWTSIYQLFWCAPGVHGFDPLPYLEGMNISESQLVHQATRDHCRLLKHRSPCPAAWCRTCHFCGMLLSIRSFKFICKKHGKKWREVQIISTHSAFNSDPD